MKLLAITLQNFKGIKEYTFEPKGQSANVYGDNATGKTTLFDAFCWLLFGKDSRNRAVFGIKTLDKAGNEIPNLEHSVTAVIEHNGVTSEYKRVFREVWKKKRGSATANFSGHTTEYFVNGVPVKEKEYNDEVANIIDVSNFQLLSNPLYFNEVMDWKARRKLLMQSFANITDDDVLQQHPELKAINNEQNTIEQYNKIIAAKKSDINKKIDEISIRIDEASKACTADGRIDTAGIDELIAKQNTALDKVIADIKGYQVADPRDVYDAELAKLRTQYAEQKTVYDGGLKMKQFEYEDKRKELQRQRNEVESRVKHLQNTSAIHAESIKTYQRYIDELLERYNNLPAFTFDEICPTCGQPMPADKVEEAKAKYNEQRAQTIEKLNADGNAYRKKMDDEISAKSLDDGAIEKGLQQLAEIDDKLADLVKPETPQPFEETEISKTLLKQMDEVQAKRDSAEPPTVPAELLAEKQCIENSIAALKQEQATAMANNTAYDRIEKLRSEQGQLVGMYEELEKQAYLIEEFTRKKVAMLEQAVNQHFTKVTFKMFKNLVNGGIEECCEAMVDNVPYTALNNAARINAGLDIISTFSKLYNIDIPIFIDNAEAVTKLYATNSQLIRLVVDENYPTLTIKEA